MAVEEIDLFEVKSGTKVNPRYVADLALQAHVLAACGHKLRAAYLLTVNPKYVHKEGADYPPMQLLRSADVTATTFTARSGVEKNRLARTPRRASPNADSGRCKT